jgi:hypothetical protein
MSPCAAVICMLSGGLALAMSAAGKPIGPSADRPQPTAVVKEEVREKDEWEQIIPGLIEAGEERHQSIQQLDDSYRQAIEEVLALSGADESEVAAIRQAAEKWKQEQLEHNRRQTRKELIGLKDAQRKAAIEEGATYPRGNYAITEERKKELLGRLSQESRERLERSKVQRVEKAKQLKTELATLVVAESVPLSAKQKKEVEKIANAFGDGVMENFLNFQYDPNPWEAWTGQQRDRLRKVLDKEQDALLTQLLDLYEGRGGGHAEDGEIPKIKVADPDLGPGDGEGVEALVSAHLARMESQLVLEHKVGLMIRADEVSLVTNMDAQGRDHLRLAASGSVVQAIRQHRDQYSTYIRQQTRNLPEEQVQMWLQNSGRFGYSNRNGEVTLLDQVIEARLTAEQKLAVKQHEEKLRLERNDLIARLLVARLEGVLLTDEATGNRLLEMSKASLADYGPDIEIMVGNWQRMRPWYLHGYYLPLALTGIPRKEIESMLSPRQLELWQEHVDSRTGHFQEHIQRAHEQRIKVSKPANP